MDNSYLRTLVAVAALGAKEQERVVKALVAHLTRTGKMELLPRLLKALRERSARTTLLAPRVEVARKSEEKGALALAKEAGIDAPHAEVNPAIIHGWRACGNGVLVDASGKRGLLEIYKRAVSSTE